jgi:aspartyl-tRNA synthetase
MAFVSADQVMGLIERLIHSLWLALANTEIPPMITEFGGTLSGPSSDFSLRPRFETLTYRQAMESYGSDKPDTRLMAKITRVEDLVDVSFKSKISPLSDPIVDMMRVRVGSNPKATRQFITSFLDGRGGLDYLNNPDGAPAICIFDPSSAMSGLAALEHHAAETVIESESPQRGDLLVFQARPNRPFMGEGSTMMGNLRRDLHTALVSQGHAATSQMQDAFLWITDFPLFSPADGSEPGQGGKAGIKSTHHPFTAPKDLSSVDNLVEDPLKCVGDHFDLVMNGVEVGGGSRRIHDSKVQEMVLRDILKVPAKGVEEFRPLLEALRAGCPPHAGIALGFDRLMTIILGTNSVRDVIAFPKTGDGEDKAMGAPAAVDQQRWAEYHLAVKS